MSRFSRLLAPAIAAVLALGALPAPPPVAPAPALAVEPHEMLDDPALEARAREISRKLRCLVCQNQSIDDSNADLAADLRVLVRERLEKGDTNQEVIDFVVARYGDFVLLEPPMKPKTYALWYGPAAVLVLGLAGVAVYYRRRRRAAQAVPPPLDDDERRRLNVLLEEEREEDRD